MAKANGNQNYYPPAKAGGNSKLEAIQSWRQFSIATGAVLIMLLVPLLKKWMQDVK